MKIHLITNLFHPDELAGAALYTDLARYFHQRGHEIRVTTTFSYYPAWKLAPEDRGIALREESWEGIPLRRLAMHVPRHAGGLGRLLSDASFLWALVRQAPFPNWKPDVIISACPMLSQCLAQRFLYPRQGIPRLLIVQDFVVDAALELGILRFPGIGWVLHRLESWALGSATTLSTISPQMLAKLNTKVPRSPRPHLFIPNWIHQSLAREIEQQRASPPARAPHQLLYSGNVGVKQGLPDFVDTFEKIQSGWQLRIQGGGAERDRLQARVQDLPEIVLADVSGEDAYVHSLLSATACLITQRPDVSANFLPSKLLPALATGTPVLAICTRDSPLGQEVLQGGYGAVIHPDDTDGIAQTLTEWRRHPEILSSYEKRARQRSALFDRQTILGTYERELAALCRPSPITSAEPTAHPLPLQRS